MLEIRLEADPQAICCEMALPDYRDPWYLYDRIAEDMARKGLTGAEGEPLPPGVTSDVADLIDADIEAFQRRVRAFKYAREMANVRIGDE